MAPDKAYEAYLAEGAALLARILDSSHFELVGGKLVFSASLPADLVEQISNWGADLDGLEAEDVA